MSDSKGLSTAPLPGSETDLVAGVGSPRAADEGTLRGERVRPRSRLVWGPNLRGDPCDSPKGKVGLGPTSLDVLLSAKCSGSPFERPPTLLLVRETRGLKRAQSLLWLFQVLTREVEGRAWDSAQTNDTPRRIGAGAGRVGAGASRGALGGGGRAGAGRVGGGLPGGETRTSEKDL